MTRIEQRHTHSGGIRTDTYSVRIVTDTATMHEWLEHEDAVTDRRWGVFGPQIGDPVPVTPGIAMHFDPPTRSTRVHVVMRLDSGTAISYTEPMMLWKGCTFTLVLDPLADSPDEITS